MSCNDRTGLAVPRNDRTGLAVPSSDMPGMAAAADSARQNVYGGRGRRAGLWAALITVILVRLLTF